jgi:hypothetical protein
MEIDRFRNKPLMLAVKRLHKKKHRVNDILAG